MLHLSVPWTNFQAAANVSLSVKPSSMERDCVVLDFLHDSESELTDYVKLDSLHEFEVWSGNFQGSWSNIQPVLPPLTFQRPRHLPG
jgi:hypothetical protein